MMKTYSVFVNYSTYDKIYISDVYDMRLDSLIVHLKNAPSVIVTQEGGFGDDERVNLLYKAPIENGVCIYSYNIEIELSRINTIPDSISEMIGNTKSVDVEFMIDNKLVRVCGLHCKEPKENAYNGFVNEGLYRLYFNSKGVFSHFQNMFEWLYNKYYGIETFTVILGDLNPKDNEKSLYVKNLLKKNCGVSLFPSPTKNINTTNKTRSGYCAQMSKFWKESKVSKDLVILPKDALVNSSYVFPDAEELLTEKWCGDHSAVIVNVSL